MYEIIYHAQILSHDGPNIEKTFFDRIENSIKTKLATRPELYGTTLRGQLDGHWKLRVGDYRVIYAIREKSVYIMTIGHRKDAYQKAKRRI